MRYNIQNADELSRYLYLKYLKKPYDPLEEQYEYIKLIINNTIDEVIQTLYHLEKDNLGAINELKTYKFRILLKNKQEEFEILNQFIHDNLIDLEEIYSICYEFLAMPLIVDRQSNDMEKHALNQY
jgi:hypothetical protein